MVDKRQPALIIYQDGSMEQLTPVTIGWLLEVGNGIIRQAQGVRVMPPPPEPVEKRDDLGVD